MDVCPALNAAPIAQAEKTRRSRPHPHPRPAKPHQVTPESLKSPLPVIATDSITLRCIRDPEKRAETRSLSGPDQVLCTTPTAPGHLSLPSLISPTYYHSLSLSFANSLVRQQDSASLAQPRRKREKKEPDLFNAPRTTTTTNLSGYSGFLPSRWRTPQEDKLGGGFTRRHPRPGCWPVRRGRQGKESAQDAIPRETTTTGTHVRVVERSVRAL